MKPTLFLLIGVPGSGKSTWVKSHSSDAVIVSTDDYIEQVAKNSGLTYNDVFLDTIKEATSAMFNTAKTAILNQQNVIWDQTSTTVSSRKKKIKMFPSEYHKVAVFFHCPPDDILNSRLESRPGKIIAPEVIKQMKENLKMPTLEEGFDEIIEVKNF